MRDISNFIVATFFLVTTASVAHAQEDAGWIRADINGSVVIKTEAGDYTWPILALTNTEFEPTDGGVRLVAEYTKRNTGRQYSVDMTFECPPPKGN